MTKLVQVDLQERSYPIWIGSQKLEEHLLAAVERFHPLRHAFIVFDEHLEPLSQAVETVLKNKGIKIDRTSIPSGESSKCIQELSRLWEAMLNARLDRKSVVIAIGGGVVGDLGGFAAATYMRGVRFLQIPTTLLAMVDSSVGGKTGINLTAAKNIIGAFWQPHGVVIDTQALQTLPDREYISGLAEIVKYGIILDAPLFHYLENNADRILVRDPECVEFLIERSCQLKAHVVANDERETTGLRAILNYGHTFGHAIEAITTYGTYLHGEAIAIGMTMAGWLAVELRHWTDTEFQRQTQLLQKLRLPISCQLPIHRDAMLRAMQSDKKNEHGVLSLILPTRIGEVKSFQGIDRNPVHQAILQYAPQSI